MRPALLIPLAAALLAGPAFAAAAAEPDPLAPVVPESKPKAKKAEPKKAKPVAAADEAPAEPAAKKAKAPAAADEAAAADPAAEPAKPVAKKAPPKAAAEDGEPAKAEPVAKPDAAKEPAKADAKLVPAPKPPPLPKPGKPPPPAPVLVHVVPFADPSVVGPACDEACIKSTAAKLRGRAGVKKATAEGLAVVLEVQPGVFKPSSLAASLEGMRIEMRPPYKAIELHFLPEGPFPPVSHVEEDVLVIDIADAARKAIEAGTKARVPTKLKCIGKLAGAEVFEAILTRYEEEKRPPVSMLPFMAEADMDGDKKPDLYLRLEGVGEVVIFTGKDGELKASLAKEGSPDSLPRCDATPTRFVRAVPKQKVKCMEITAHAGDAIERVVLNKSNDLLLFNAGKFASCEPLGEGAMPTVPRPAGKTKKGDDPKKKPEDEW